METPSSPIAEGSRALPTQAPMPAMRIERLKDLDAVSARHYVDEVFATLAIGGWVASIFGFLLALVGAFALHIDTHAGVAVIATGLLIWLCGLAVRILRRMQRRRAAEEAAIAFPIEREIDVIVADLVKAKRRVRVDEVFAVLMEKVAAGNETTRSEWLARTRVRRRLRPVMTFTFMLALGASLQVLHEADRGKRAATGRSAPAHAAQLRPYWQTMTTEQQRELAILWVARAVRVHLADACARASMVDVADKLRALPQPVTKDDAATIRVALADVAELAHQANDTPVATAAFVIMSDLDRVTKPDFNEDDLSWISLTTLTAARTCGADAEEEAWQRSDVGAPAFEPIKNR